MKETYIKLVANLKGSYHLVELGIDIRILLK